MLIKLPPGGWDEPNSCELFYVPLDDKPKYIALSYAWADATENREVKPNGQVYRITTSLFAGLRRLQYMVSVADKNPETFITEKVENFRLWADAICAK
jgi:hypothetical protein